jgi:hypothetical protein
MPALAGLALWLTLALLLVGGRALATTLGARGGEFTVNGRPAFLLGISDFGALGEPEALLRKDLDEMQRDGFNWIRVWATWSAFGADLSAVDAEGNPRPEFLTRLRKLVEECDRRGLIVDVTLSRDKGTSSPPRLPTLEAHRRAVETLLRVLKPHRNWYLDLANERNIRDSRFVPFAELTSLRDTVKRLDPARLVTASHGGDMSRDELREYLMTVRVDLVAPHRPREPGSAAQTEAKTREYRTWMRELGRVVPLQYQEPFRRGYGAWQPAAKEFVTDAQGAKAGGAAGWCFHNGAERDHPDGQPRRSFDLREHRLFDQLDEEERQAIDGLWRLLDGRVKKVQHPIPDSRAAGKSRS